MYMYYSRYTNNLQESAVIKANTFHRQQSTVNQCCNNLGLSNEYLNDVYDSVVADTVCKPVGRIVENCMTNGLAYEAFKNFKNRPGSAKYVPCKMLAYITGCTLSDKRIHAIRLQLVRLEAWVQKLRGVSRDSFMCEIFKFSQSS